MRLAAYYGRSNGDEHDDGDDDDDDCGGSRSLIGHFT